jgi:hypothetical protein
MDMVAIFEFGIIAVIIVVLYFMFGTRRTILRIFGWTLGIFTIGFFFVHALSRPRPLNANFETSKIINDLRNLRAAAHMFYDEFETWPLPGQEASIDAFGSHPIVLANPPRYARVMLTAKSCGADIPPERYIGVELIPEKNGAEDIQKTLARKAPDTGLLQQPVSSDIYKSGLGVYMRIYGMESVSIIKDLPYLCEAARMFYKEFETWPLPGQEASLDAYCDRPIVLAEPPRYAKVILADKPGDADNPPELYIGVELIPERSIGIGDIFHRRATNIGLLQQPVSGDIYRSGLSVYMRVF